VKDTHIRRRQTALRGDVRGKMGVPEEGLEPSRCVITNGF
jgi:hypothetical protein